MRLAGLFWKRQLLYQDGDMDNVSQGFTEKAATSPKPLRGTVRIVFYSLRRPIRCFLLIVLLLPELDSFRIPAITFHFNVMARSDVSSLDVDVEKLDAFSFGERPISITGDQLSARRGSIAGSQLRGRPVSRGVSPSTSRPTSTASRPQSRNFSRPSPRSSFTESNIHPAKRRRSSDYERELARVNRPHSVSPDFHTPSPLSRSESASEGSLPPFAPKAMLQAELREPPPVPLPPLPSLPLYSPPSSERLNRSRKSTRSMDILEAARQQQLPMHNGGSTRELLSTITEKSRVEPSTFAQRVFTAGKPDLLYELRERKRLKDRRNGVLDFTTLERMNTHVLQQKLVEQVKAIGEKNAWMEIGIKETLHDYCKPGFALYSPTGS